MSSAHIKFIHFILLYTYNLIYTLQVEKKYFKKFLRTCYSLIIGIMFFLSLLKKSIINYSYLFKNVLFILYLKNILNYTIFITQYIVL
jgi:hypothetical protein